MAWSTRQLADLAGTTVKTVRHYHDLKLLDEPERATNGYKQYGITHLVRLLRIKRMSDLGMPLSQITTMGQSDESPEEALKLIDAELAESIDRLRKVRAELELILRHDAPTDLPPGFADVASKLTDADRALILIYSRVFGPESMESLRQMLQESHDSVEGAEFDALPADADERVRQNLAERYAPFLADLTLKYPWIANPGAGAPRGAAFAENVVAQAIIGLYNPAQVDVLRRAYALMPVADA